MVNTYVHIASQEIGELEGSSYSNKVRGRAVLNNMQCVNGMDGRRKSERERWCMGFACRAWIYLLGTLAALSVIVEPR